MQSRRFLPDGHEFRTDHRWERPEHLPPPNPRTQEQQLRFADEVVTLCRVQGKQAAKKGTSRRGVREHDPGARLTYHDIIRDTPIDPAHTISGVIKHHHQCFRGKRKLKLHSFPIEGTPRRQAATAETFSYVRILDHEDDETSGERAQYRVLWSDGSTTWVSLETLREDVELGEGQWDNAITRYEARLVSSSPRASPRPSLIDSRDPAVEFSVWVDRTKQLALSEKRQERADASLSAIPHSSSILPWSCKAPFTSHQRMKMHDYILWVEHWAPYHLRGQFDVETNRILCAFYDFLRRLVARSIRPSEIHALEELAPIVLSELELVLPPTQWHILLHMIVHLPEQMSWFGPCSSNWMFLYER